MALLRQCAGLDRVLQKILGRTAGIATARAQATGQKRVEPLPWAAGARRLEGRLHRMRADAEARARVVDPTYVAFGVDEGAGRRAAAAKKKVAAVAALARAPGVPGVHGALARAARSPLVPVAHAARAALAAEVKPAPNPVKPAPKSAERAR